MRYTPDEWGKGKAFSLFDWIKAMVRLKRMKKNEFRFKRILPLQ